MLSIDLYSLTAEAGRGRKEQILAYATNYMTYLGGIIEGLPAIY